MTIDSATRPPSSDRSPATTAATATFHVASDGSITPTTEQKVKKHDTVIIQLAVGSTFSGDIYVTKDGSHMCDQIFDGVTTDDNYLIVGTTYTVRAKPSKGSFVVTTDDPGGCTGGTNGDLHVGSGGQQGCD